MIDYVNIANYADDNASFVTGDTPLNVITSLENVAEKTFEWFTNNHMKAYLRTVESSGKWNVVVTFLS